MAANDTGYNQNSSINGPSDAGGGAAATDAFDENGFWTLERCMQAYSSYLNSKTAEIQEQQNARRYRHCNQWTAEEIKKLNDRQQPIVTYNRIGRKIDGIVGLVEKLRQDPKAFPRTPQHQAGADLATAVLRYMMERNEWKDKKSLVAEKAAIDGLAGIELGLKLVPAAAGQEQKQPDYDVTFDVVDNDGYFYDPRSFLHNFNDATFQGMGKWVDKELLLRLMPKSADVINTAFDSGFGGPLSSQSDRDNRWFMDSGKFPRARLVDIWYKKDDGWLWALFTRGGKLAEGKSPFTDEFGVDICKYLMFSAQVDQDGDRYGFPRNLISAQDEINQRRSKALHELNNRRIRATRAAIADDDVEKIRKEAARSDGVILSNTSVEEIQFDDAAKQQAIMGHLEFLKEAKAEIENFGPNPAVLGQGGAGGGMAGSSGRAIALMQQSGIAELGPYMLNLRSWNVRLYRALFNAARKYWTNERWIRVTDDEGMIQFVQINGVSLDPS